MGRPRAEVELTVEQREVLAVWVRRSKTGQALARRARIVLLCGDGLTDTETAQRLGVSKQLVGKWRQRFVDKGVDGLLDEPRPGQPRKIGDADVERVIAKTLEERPRGATHWSTRTMAKATGLNQTAISRIWRAFALQPHRQETFKLSKDPLFIDKVRDIVGLYMNPPDKALVLCVDEKSQIQALDRTQPAFPMLPGTPARRTHDYIRNGTTSLFAAFDTATGRVIGQTHRRHRAAEFRKFLDRIDAEVPANLDVHMILDNYGTHKTPAIRAWFARHPRYHLHFTPTSASWINLVERWFAALTDRRIRRGSFRSTRQLEDAIREYITIHNESPKPFIWTKSADDIFTSIAKYCQRINDSGH